MIEEQIQSAVDASKEFPLPPAVAELVTDASLSVETLQFVGPLARTRKAQVICEFGSGVSTLLLASILAPTPEGKLVSFEHSREYLEHSRRLIGNASHVTLAHCPIEYYWYGGKRLCTYDPDSVARITRGLIFDMVLVDGPPGGGRIGREATLYQVAQCLSPDTLIVMDDTARDDEQAVMRTWSRVWAGEIDRVSLPHLKKGMSVMRLRSPDIRVRWPFGPATMARSWLRSRAIYRQERARRVAKCD